MILEMKTAGVNLDPSKSGSFKCRNHLGQLRYSNIELMLVLRLKVALIIIESMFISPLLTM